MIYHFSTPFFYLIWKEREQIYMQMSSVSMGPWARDTHVSYYCVHNKAFTRTEGFLIIENHQKTLEFILNDKH